MLILWIVNLNSHHGRTFRRIIHSGSTLFFLREAQEAIAQASSASVLRNRSLETSLNARILALENKGSLFIRWDGNYGDSVKDCLESTKSQADYNFKMEFESRELQLRELREETSSLVKQFLHPDFLKKADEFYFLTEMSEKIAESFRDSRLRHGQELQQLNAMIRDLKRNGSASSTFLFRIVSCPIRKRASSAVGLLGWMELKSEDKWEESARQCSLSWHNLIIIRITERRLGLISLNKEYVGSRGQPGPAPITGTNPHYCSNSSSRRTKGFVLYL